MKLQPLPETTPERRITATEAAKRLKVSKVHVFRLVESGHLAAEWPAGRGAGKPATFDPADVERLRAMRAGEIGDELDRVDVYAAGAEPSEDHNAYVRAAWVAAVEAVVKQTGGTFHTGQLRAHLPEDARGHAPGAFITGLVRGRRIEHTGDYGTLSDPLARHSESPCKVYRVIGEIA